MILIYNILLTVSFLLLLPLLALIVMVRSKYRGRTMERLGLKTVVIKKKLAETSRDKPVIWIHALSVGEVTSALPLVRAIRDDMKSAVIIFTAATRSGRQVADDLIAPYVNLILYSPFDLSFAVQRYIAAIRPNLFILVETDFWPNWLDRLKKQKIPVMLVNGRISKKSFAAYNRFLFFFKPMFNCFALLSMQTVNDADKMINLGLAPEKVITLNNLKYDMDIKSTASPLDQAMPLPAAEKLIWVCGSTHQGEEEILFSAFKRLDRIITANKSKGKKIFLILAPRDISRGSELIQLAQQFNLEPHTRSSGKTGGNVLILDTIGELASCYGLAQMAFVGGSLVKQGGHNPIEPAVHGVPILFGSHMEDFSEISHDLVACGGAKTIDAESLTAVAADILTRNEVHTAMAEAAGSLVAQHRGGLISHLQEIHRLLRQ